MTDTPSLRRSFRLVCNPGQIPSVEALLSAQGFVFEPEPFSPLARRLLQEPFPLGRSLAAFWGYVYIQDRSSMLPPLALAPGEGARVLDMCASPGSKTGLLAQLVGREGLVLGNEPARPRLANLRRNLAALNLLQAVTCSWPGESLPLPDASWDAVLLDPPCSGWGTTDKNPQAIKRWQGDRLKPMLELQRKLLTEASRLLRPGGKLVYSTCTTNVDENEGQVRFAVEGLGLEPIPLEPFPGFVFAAPELPGCEGTLRVDEDASNAQGFYIALLRKPGDSVAVPGLARGTAATAAYRAIPPAFLAEFGLSPALLPPGDLAVFEDSLHFLPAPALAHLPAAVRWQGMALGKASAQGLIPSARLRALLDPEPQRIPRLDVDDVPVLERLLQGGSLDTGLPGKEASLFWRGLPLGRLRLKAGRAVWRNFLEKVSPPPPQSPPSLQRLSCLLNPCSRHSVFNAPSPHRGFSCSRPCKKPAGSASMGPQGVPMLIEIRRFATLPPHTPENDRLDVAEGTTAGEAMHILNIRSAEPLILVNGVHAGPDRILNDGDRLAFVPAAEAANS